MTDPFNLGDVFDGLKDEKTREFFSTILGVNQTKCSCGSEGELRPWPPDATTGPKFCGACRLKKAAGL